MTKAQRRQQHAEQQKQLWDGAENPARNHWLEAQGIVPLKQEFKPQVQLLSRKPAAPVIARKDAANGVANLNLEDDEDSEEEAKKKQQADLEERQRRAKIEREEKARKYAEARERIMGSSTPTSPAPPASRESSHGRDNRKSRLRHGKKESQPTSSADQSPARLVTTSGDKQLFDPDDMSRRTMPKREPTSAPKEDHPSRQPKGPECGRGGFGFGGRGGRPVS